MHSSTFTLAVAASVALPTFAAPINKAVRESDLEARKISFGSAAKSLSGGIATGGLFALLGSFLGGGGEETAPAKRSLLLETREPKGGLATILGTALLGGVGSAIGGTAIGSLFSRDEPLTDDESALLALIMLADQKEGGIQARALTGGDAAELNKIFTKIFTLNGLLSRDLDERALLGGEVNALLTKFFTLDGLLSRDLDERALSGGDIAGLNEFFAKFNLFGRGAASINELD